MSSGCPDEDASPDARFNNPSHSPFVNDCVALYREYCRYFDRCSHRWSPDVEASVGAELYCHPSIAEASCGVYDRSVAAGRLVFHADRLHACAAAIAGSTSCAGTSFTDVCEPFITGARRDGESCYLHQECQSQRCILSAACPGICQPRGLEGEYCEIHENCADGLYCYGPMNQCRPLPSAGEMCFTGACPEDQYCPSAGPRVCSTRHDLGEPCEPARTGDRECNGDLVCAPSGGEHACSPLKTAGGECDFHEDCESALICPRRVCITGEPRGAACGRDKPCSKGLTCTARMDGTCVELVGPGETCFGGSICVRNFFCNSNGVCEPLPRPGETCDAARPCFRGSCVNGVCELTAIGGACVSEDLGLWPFDDCDHGVCVGHQCAAGKQRGEPCFVFGDDMRCAPGLICVSGYCCGPE